MAAIIFTSATAILTSIGIVDLLFVTPGYVAKTVATTVMLVVQILVIVFSYRVLQEMTEPNS